MKISVVILAKFSSLLLIGALSIILFALLKDIFLSNTPDDGSMIAAALLVLIPWGNSLFMLYFCNVVLREEIPQPSPSKTIAFLISGILSFVFSIVVVIAVSDAIIDVLDERTITTIFERGVGDTLLLLSIVIFAILGFLGFFLQLYVRKAFLLKVKSSTDRFIDSIGN